MSFNRLIRFQSTDKQILFADWCSQGEEAVSTGQEVTAYATFDDLLAKKDARNATVDKLLAPVPRIGLPIYCVGLNYRSHGEEAHLPIPKLPPVWTKPAAALANPDQDIILNDFCARSLPDYEAELVFVTSKECKDLRERDAEDSILGYTIGNDLSCRLFQMPAQQGGQFFYAKAFDDFAPIGPVLLSKAVFHSELKNSKLEAVVNGEVRQSTVCSKDMIFSPATILSHMSQGTTIPAGTIVMTGTPAGVGAFQKPKCFLNHDDVVEVRLGNSLVLRNRIKFK